MTIPSATTAVSDEEPFQCFALGSQTLKTDQTFQLPGQFYCEKNMIYFGTFLTYSLCFFKLLPTLTL